MCQRDGTGQALGLNLRTADHASMSLRGSRFRGHTIQGNRRQGSGHNLVHTRQQYGKGEGRSGQENIAAIL